jgi:tryptophanyl-tRNA synthetase
MIAAEKFPLMSRCHSLHPLLPRQCRSYSTAPPRTIFSGIQPTGIPHLGNYLGALKPWVSLQHAQPDAKIFYSIVDLHAITTPFEGGQLRRDREVMWRVLHAVGIDMERCVVFEQSAVTSLSPCSLRRGSRLGLVWILCGRMLNFRSLR